MAAICFGTLGPASRAAVEDGMTSSAFAAWRGIIATLALVGVTFILAARGQAVVVRQGLDRRTAAALVAAAASNVILNLAVFASFQLIPIAVALVGFYTFPAMVAVVAVALGREALGPGRLIALGMAMVGMVLVVGASTPPAGVGDGNRLWLGVGLALVGAAAQTVYLTISRTEYRHLPAHEVGVVAGGLAAATMAIVAVALGGVAAMTMPFTVDTGWGPLLWAGLVGASVPYVLLLTGIRAIGSTSAAILMLFEPLTGAFLAAVILAEALTPGQLAGGALILAAAVILQRQPAHAADLPVGAVEA